MKTICVSPRVAEQLKIGDGVINEVKRLMQFGSGNQIQCNHATGGESSIRTNAARMVMNASGGLSPLRMMGPALAFGAGNCGEHASVAYVLLRQCLNATFTAELFSSTQIDHAYAGFYWNGSPHEKIIVDPWPLKAQALRASEHFLHKNTPMLVAQRSKICGKQNRLVKVQSRLDGINLEAAFREAQKFASGHQYDHIYADGAGPVEYVVCDEPMEID